MIDLLSKHWVFQWRGMPRPDNLWWIWPNYIGIETALNTGALFGFGQNQAQLFAVLSFAAASGILYWLFIAGGISDWILTICLGCMMGGILGNLYDRLALWTAPGVARGEIHAVRDWILLRYGNFTWPNFNIADSLLVSAAILMIWHQVRLGHSSTVKSAGDTG